MACSSPLVAYVLSDGRQHWVERAGFDYVGTRFIACGKCSMCRIKKAMDWSTRIQCEAYVHREITVATLTYSPENIPALDSLCERDLDLFLKRLRISESRRAGASLRVSKTGEYSPRLLRPHYHVILFGYWPSDARVWGNSRSGNTQYISDELTKLWGLGFVTFQPFTPEAASYIASHDSWKLTDDRARRSQAVHSVDGDFLGFRESEFFHPSRMPGLGAGFCDIYGKSILSLDAVVLAGRKRPIPTYFLDRLEASFPDFVASVRAKHEQQMVLAYPDSTWERLAVREICAATRIRRQRREGIDHALY